MGGYYRVRCSFISKVSSMNVFDCIPQNSCPVCKSEEWYLPGDYYWGVKKPICRVCHPEPLGSVITLLPKSEKIGDTKR